jgi:hypothetical protein
MFVHVRGWAKLIEQQAATHKYQSSLKAVLHILNTEGISGQSTVPLFCKIPNFGTDTHRPLCWATPQAYPVRPHRCIHVRNAKENL